MGICRRRCLEIWIQKTLEQHRMRELMHQYQDVPMDLADASLVAANDLKAAIALNPKKYQEDISNGDGKGNSDCLSLFERRSNSSDPAIPRFY